MLRNVHRNDATAPRRRNRQSRRNGNDVAGNSGRSSTGSSGRSSGAIQCTLPSRHTAIGTPGARCTAFARRNARFASSTAEGLPASIAGSAAGIARCASVYSCADARTMAHSATHRSASHFCESELSVRSRVPPLATVSITSLPASSTDHVATRGTTISIRSTHPTQNAGGYLRPALHARQSRLSYAHARRRVLDWAPPDSILS